MQGALRLRRDPFERRARARMFVAIFTGVVLGSLAGLGVIVAHLAGESVEAAGADGAEASAATLVRVTLRPGDLRDGRLRPSAFERLSRAALVSGVIDEVRVWRRGGRVVRDAHGATAAATRRSRALEQAFAGAIGSEVAHDAAAAPHAGQGRCHERREMRVFVPLHRRRGGPIQEVLELCAPHAAIAQAASDRRRGLLVVVLVGALLLWLVVLPAVLTSARLLAAATGRSFARCGTRCDTTS